MSEKIQSTKGKRAPAKKQKPEEGAASEDNLSMIGKLADQARQQVMTRLLGQKEAVAERLTNVGDKIREAAESMAEHAPQAATDYMGRAADSVERLTKHIANADVEDLVGDVETFMRRHPGFVLGGGLAAGFLIARLLRTSAPKMEIGA